MDNIAVIIPCYNEATTIKQVIYGFKTALQNKEYKIYVYDNNSTDNTSEIAQSCGENVIVRYEYQQGKGNVIRRMFREINAKCYIMVDGDNTYSPNKASEMADLVLNKQVDMVIGDRLSSSYFTENKRRFHNFGNNLVRKSVNFLFKSNIKDIMTGYRAFSYQFVKTFPVLSKNFEIETEMTIHAVDKNMSTYNVVIDYSDRQEGSFSKLNTYIDGAKVIGTIFKLFAYYKPLKFFGLITIILTLLALLLFMPIFIEYINTGLVLKFPTLFICGFIEISAINSFFTGLILEAIRHRNRQNFELNLININMVKNNECI